MTRWDLKDGGGPRTDKISSKEDGGGRGTNPFRSPHGRIRTQDGEKIFRADGNGRRTDPFGPPQGRVRTSDGKIL